MDGKFKLINIKEEIRYDGKDKKIYNCGIFAEYKTDSQYIIYLDYPDYSNELSERLNRLRCGDIIKLRLKKYSENKWICTDII